MTGGVPQYSASRLSHAL